MPIVFRCEYCQQLMSIATRRAGAEVSCPQCGRLVVVPAESAHTVPAEPPAAPAPQPLSAPLPSAERRQTPAPQGVPEPVAFVSPVSDAARDPDDDESADDESADDEPWSLTRRPGRERGEMDLTPMVDVTFLLLIFFMITASFDLQKTLEIPAPDPDQTGAVQSLQLPEDLHEFSVIVEIDARDRLFVDDEPLSDLTRLPDVLRERRQGGRKTEILIQSSPQARHETVVTVVDAANDVGMQRIRLTLGSAEN